MNNIFGINVGSKTGTQSNIISTNPALSTEVSGIFKYLLMGILIFGTIGTIYYLLLERKKKKDFQKSEKRFWMNMK